MKASHVPQSGVVRIVDAPVPHPARPGEFLVEMISASICGSDIHAALAGDLHPLGPQTYGYPGHEGVGKVVESRSERFREGDLVLALPPGEIGTGFAEYQCLDDDHALAIPPDADPWHLMLAQPLGTTIFAMKLFWPTEIPPRTTGTAVVHGAGATGLFMVQNCFRQGFTKVISTDLEPGRLEVAAALGAIPVKADEGSTTEVVLDATGGEGAELVIDCVGTTQVRNLCLQQVRDLGIVGCFGLPDDPAPELQDFYTAFRKRTRIQYAVAAQSEPGLLSFREALRRILDDEVVTDYCLASRYPLSQLPEALQVARERGRGKVKVNIGFGSHQFGRMSWSGS